MKKQRKKLHYLRGRFLLSLLYLVVFALICLLLPLLPLDPTQTDVTALSQAPSAAHWFGTDEVGRDYLARVLYGGRISLVVGLLSMLATTAIGVVVGSLSGYFRGWLDTIFMRIVDVLSAIPWLVLVIVLSVLLKPGLGTIVLVIGGFSWTHVARLVRAEVLSAKERSYVEYGAFIGLSHAVIIRRHVLPQILPTIMVAATTSVSSAMMTESALSFLGLGIQPPIASWGSLLQNAQSTLQEAPYMALLPGFFLLVTIYALNTLGEALQNGLLREEKR